MSTGLSEVEALIRKLDLDFDLDEVRREAAHLVLQELEARRDALTSWEKMHLEMAIALLPTSWLRLCLTHLRMALEPPAPEVRAQVERERNEQFELITPSELVARLKRLDLLAR